MQSIQMELSKKQKAFSDLFAAFLEFTLNIKHFQKKKKKKKIDPHSLCIFEIIDFERRA